MNNPVACYDFPAKHKVVSSIKISDSSSGLFDNQGTRSNIIRI